MADARPLRVVQWTAGSIARQAVHSATGIRIDADLPLLSAHLGGRRGMAA